MPGDPRRGGGVWTIDPKRVEFAKYASTPEDMVALVEEAAALVAARSSAMAPDADSGNEAHRELIRQGHEGGGPLAARWPVPLPDEGPPSVNVSRHVLMNHR